MSDVRLSVLEELRTPVPHRLRGFVLIAPWKDLKEQRRLFAAGIFLRARSSASFPQVLLVVTVESRWIDLDLISLSLEAILLLFGVLVLCHLGYVFGILLGLHNYLMYSSSKLDDISA